MSTERVQNECTTRANRDGLVTHIGMLDHSGLTWDAKTNRFVLCSFYKLLNLGIVGIWIEILSVS